MILPAMQLVILSICATYVSHSRRSALLPLLGVVGAAAFSYLYLRTESSSDAPAWVTVAGVTLFTAGTVSSTYLAVRLGLDRPLSIFLASLIGGAFSFVLSGLLAFFVWAVWTSL